MSSPQPFQASLRCSLAIRQVETLMKQLSLFNAQISEYQDEPCPAYLAECQATALLLTSTVIDIALLVGVPVPEIQNATK